MAYTWTKEMRSITTNPAVGFEEHARAAVIAACEHWDTLAEGASQPRFSGSIFVVPQNKAAEDLVAAIVKNLPAMKSAVERETVISIAVHAGDRFMTGGRGEAGWAAIAAALPARAEHAR